METIISTNIEDAADWLRKDEVIGMPTETVYGLAGNALHEDAVLKIYLAKGRPRFNPLIVHVPDMVQAEKFITRFPEPLRHLAEKCWPGSLTILLPKNNRIPDLVTAGNSKVGLRVPSHPVTLQLLHMLSFPLAAPSANPFGYVSPTTAQHVMKGLGGKIPFVLDGGPCAVGLESTIVDFDKEHQRVLIRRVGGIGQQQIEQILGQKVKLELDSSRHPVAPGQLKSHYATRLPLYIGELSELNLAHRAVRRLLLGWGSIEEILMEAAVDDAGIAAEAWSLSESKNLNEVAKNLFSFMRKADESGFDVILAPRFPDQDIGKAINDRLAKASHQNKAWLP
jgi:L-threonylcarbamoyladenylate synthase